MPFLTTKDNLKIYYNYHKSKSKKSKPTLLFLHGLGSNHSSWNNYITHFKKQRNILAIDLRGYGKSTRPKAQNSYQLKYFINDIHQLITKLKLKNITIIGHSFGGVLAHILEKKPYTKQIILISTPSNRKDVTLYFMTQLYLANLLPNKIFKLLEPKKPFHQIKHKILFCIKCLANTPANIAINILNELKNAKITNKPKKLTKRYLIITANQDKVIKNQIGKLYKTTKIPGNHLAYITKHKKITKLIENFLNKKRN